MQCQLLSTLHGTVHAEPVWQERVLLAQGFGEQVDPSQIGTPAFQAAVMQVLGNPKYAQAARAASKKLRARKRTPTQEAAGVQALLSRSPLEV